LSSRKFGDFIQNKIFEIAFNGAKKMVLLFEGIWICFYSWIFLSKNENWLKNANYFVEKWILQIFIDCKQACWNLFWRTDLIKIFLIFVSKKIIFDWIAIFLNPEMEINLNKNRWNWLWKMRIRSLFMKKFRFLRRRNFMKIRRVAKSSKIEFLGIYFEKNSIISLFSEIHRIF